MEQVLDQVRNFASKTDEAGQRRLARALRDMSYALETPEDTTARIASYPLRTAAVRTGIDLKLFTHLTGSESVLSSDDLASKTGSDVSFIARYLRCLASFGFITETSSNRFMANSVTKAIDDAGRQAEIIHFFDTVGPAVHAMPEFHRQHGYIDPTAANDCPFQLAFKTSKSAFDFWPELPQYAMDAFHTYMSARTRHSMSWLSTFPFVQEVGENKPDEVVFVDVGGGSGHQCLNLRKTFPDLKGRVILQDLEGPIRGRLEHAGVEAMVHDIFKPQPIKGARFYYLRGVLHDWADEYCVSILTNLRNAMDTRSRIVIDELMLPDQGVDWTATLTDLTMMATLAAKERTQTQWRDLLDRAGLEISGQWKYEGRVGYEVLMTVRKKERP